MDENKKDRVDQIIDDIQAGREKQETEPAADPVKEEAEFPNLPQQNRDEKVNAFSLNLSFDEETNLPPTQEEKPEAEVAETETETEAQTGFTGGAFSAIENEGDKPIEKAKKSKKKKPKKKRSTVMRLVIFLLIPLLLAAVISYVAIVGITDLVGLNKDTRIRPVLVLPNASTEDVAQALVDQNIIGQPMIFRLYCRLSDADGKWQAGTFELAPSMGYSDLIYQLQTVKAKETVRVLIPEGRHTRWIADTLESAGVCGREDFLAAVTADLYDEDFAFLKEVPKPDENGKYDDKHNKRLYRLEGYLFPDTYEFNKGSSGETVVRKMLETFEKKVYNQFKDALAAQEMTLDDIIITASIIQAEGKSEDSMIKISRVLHNRLDIKMKLQCDTTELYFKQMVPSLDDSTADYIAYDTYQREGLPAGAINNPGQSAIRAALNPSNDDHVKKCYFFISDKAGNIYCDITYADHRKTGKRIGVF